MVAKLVYLGAVLVVVFGLVACSGDDGGDASSGTQQPAGADADSSDPQDEGAPEGEGGPGTLSLNDEEIVLGPGRCHLEEQPSAGGGGTIELTGQAYGTNADGDEVNIDFTRYSAESSFAGDDVSVTVGDPFSDDVVRMTGSTESGTVSLSGMVLSADDYGLDDSDGGITLISFEIAC